MTSDFFGSIFSAYLMFVTNELAFWPIVQFIEGLFAVEKIRKM
jgi:hypothetical protein